MTWIPVQRTSFKFYTIYLLVLFTAIFNSTFYAQSDSLNLFLNFMPLQVNNSWEYNYVICDPFVNCEANSYSEVITGDTLFNNKSYFTSKYIAAGNDLKYYYRIDSTNGNVFKVYHDDLNTEYRIDSLFANEGDTFLIYDIQSSKNSLNILSISDTIVKGKQSILRKTIDGSNYKTMYFSGIGILKGAGYQGSVYLNYAFINGESYDFYTDILNREEIIKNFTLFQNYPNPFNPTTAIEYTLSNVMRNSVSQKENMRFGESHYSVTLIVYDILGRKVTTLVNKHQYPGNYKVTFDASNLASGVYYYQLLAGSFSQSRKMLLVK